MIIGPTQIKRCLKCNNEFRQSTLTSGNTFGAIFWTDGKMDAPMLPDSPWLIQCPYCKSALWLDELVQVGEIDPEHDTHYSGHTPSGLPIEVLFDYKSPSVKTYYRILKQDLKEMQMKQLKEIRKRLSRHEMHRMFIPNDNPQFLYDRDEEANGLKKIIKLFNGKKCSNRLIEKERYLRIRCWWVGNNKRRRSKVMKPLTTDEIDNMHALIKLLDETDQNDRLMKAEVLREMGLFDDAAKLLNFKFEECHSKTVKFINELVLNKQTKVTRIPDDSKRHSGAKNIKEKTSLDFSCPCGFKRVKVNVGLYENGHYLVYLCLKCHRLLSLWMDYPSGTRSYKPPIRTCEKCSNDLMPISASDAFKKESIIEYYPDTEPWWLSSSGEVYIICPRCHSYTLNFKDRAFYD